MHHHHQYGNLDKAHTYQVIDDPTTVSLKCFSARQLHENIRRKPVAFTLHVSDHNKQLAYPRYDDNIDLHPQGGCVWRLVLIGSRIWVCTRLSQWTRYSCEQGLCPTNRTWCIFRQLVWVQSRQCDRRCERTKPSIRHTIMNVSRDFEGTSSNVPRSR